MCYHSYGKYPIHIPPYKGFNNHTCSSFHRQRNAAARATGPVARTAAIPYPAAVPRIAAVAHNHNRDASAAVNPPIRHEAVDPALVDQAAEAFGLESALTLPPSPLEPELILKSNPASSTVNDPPVETAERTTDLASAIGAEPPALLSPDEMVSAAEPSANAMMDAAGRLTDAVSQFVEMLNAQKRSGQEACGLHHFREWWDLVEVSICVGGNLLSGIPIFVREDTLRVVDQNYSYFIPLEKVDYIRTCDGLCSGFQPLQDQPLKK